MTAMVARGIWWLTLIVAFALWARGYANVGDGFSAGATAGIGAVLQFVALDSEDARRRVAARFARAMLVSGLLLVLAVVLAPLAWGAPPLTHQPRPDEHAMSIGVLELHTSALFDLGIGIAVYGAIVTTFDHLYPLLKGDER